MHLKFTKTHPPTQKNQARGRPPVLDPSLPLYYRFCREKVSLYLELWRCCIKCLDVHLAICYIKCTYCNTGHMTRVHSEFQWYSHMFVERKCHILYRLMFVWLFFEDSTNCSISATFFQNENFYSFALL